jgi:hypothetical protein
MNKNVTLRLDEVVIRKARHAAIERDQSLSEWIADLIAHAVSKTDRLLPARERALKRIQSGFHLGGSPLSRKEAHER